MIIATFAVTALLALPAADDCAGCHEEVVKSFAFRPHAGACATCHEGAAAHVENPSKETIRRIPRQEACLTCHASAPHELLLASPGHRRQKVACLDCHAPGHGAAAEHLLRAEPQRVCASCHRTQAARFNMPFAHRDGQQPMACTECHSPHGVRRVARQQLLDRGGVCLDCHGEMAGPFVFEHPPRDVNGCASCHDPHGSTNPRLLTRPTTAALCLECHANVPHDVTSARFRVCTSCHNAVHGSNRERRLFDR